MQVSSAKMARLIPGVWKVSFINIMYNVDQLIAMALAIYLRRGPHRNHC
jgi:hypothetical protein